MADAISAKLKFAGFRSRSSVSWGAGEVAEVHGAGTVLAPSWAVLAGEITKRARATQPTAL